MNIESQLASRQKEQHYQCKSADVIDVWSGNNTLFTSYESAFEGTIIIAEGTPPHLTAEDYPALAVVWDNNDDSIFDNM